VERPVTAFARPADLLGAVGTDLGTTPWVTVEQSRFQQFAAAVPAAPGLAEPYLALALTNLFMPELLDIEQAAMGVNYGTNAVRFPRRLAPGERIRGRAALTAAEPIAGGVQAVVTLTVEIDGAPAPACVVESVSRFFD
jgi:acyl dehydratase